jgi:hypothetical protein
MEEVAPQPENPQPRKFVLWPLFFCVMPVLIAFGLFWLINRPSASNTAENKPSSSADLGPRGTPLTPRTNTEPSANSDESSPTRHNTVVQPKPDETTDPSVTEREVEIHIKNLKFAVQHNNGRGKDLETNWLKRARPSDLVSKLIDAAWTIEQDAFVRLAFFAAIVPLEAQQGLALRGLRKDASKCLGSDELIAAGQSNELSAYLRCALRQQVLGSEVVEMVRNFLRLEKPTWLAEPILEGLEDRLDDTAKRDAIQDFWADLDELVRRATLEQTLLYGYFWLWSARFADSDAFFTALSDPQLQKYVPALLSRYTPREYGPNYTGRGLRIAQPVFDRFLGPPFTAVIRLVRQLLETSNDVVLKRWMIQMIAAKELPEPTEFASLIDAGITRRDANLPDYLAALGKMSEMPGALKRLASFASEQDVDVARGAINGLRQSPLKAADDELRMILSVGQNSGVKGDALAALLERNPQTRDALVDDYIGEDKAVGLRVIAVSYLSTKREDKLKELGENDPEVRVREAAINKLGSLKDKSLKTWFTRVSRSDPVPVLRQLAKKYAAELE